MSIQDLEKREGLKIQTPEEHKEEMISNAMVMGLTREQALLSVKLAARECLLRPVMRTKGEFFEEEFKFWDTIYGSIEWYPERKEEREDYFGRPFDELVKK